MKYALIGCGRIATNHIKAVLNNHLELAAVCDVLPQQMENLLAKHELQNDSSIHRYTDYREMIEKEQPQLVGIATESGVHAQIALFCIDHGVNVIIEKPMAMSIADANEIIHRSRKRVSRFLPATRTASMWQSSRCARRWKPDALADCPTAPSMCAGTATTATMTRQNGAAPGHRTAVR